MKKLSVFLTFLLIFMMVSCEVGLGSAVDTDAPSLTIEEPVVDSMIAGDFDIKGTYSDDGVIKDLVVVLTRTDKLGTPIKISGFLEEDPIKRGSGIWKIPVNAKSETIIDGTYQATVSIKDGVGRVTTQSTTFTIDNTPPVLILTKPNSKVSDETISEYGQRLFLAGNIADTSKQTYITVEFYDNPDFTGTPKIIKTTAIAPSDVNSNNAKLAVFGDDNYESIYGTNEKDGSKTRYIKITASDLAGNETQEFYFSKDLAKNLTKSTESGDPDAYGLAAIDIYNVLNGTDALKGTARTVDDAGAVRDLLNQTLNDDGIQTAKLNLNPENSPYFMVSGMKTLPKKWEDFASSDNGYIVINGAQTLEVSVFMGSDSIELVDDAADVLPENREFYVYLLECKESPTGGIEIAEDIPENRIKLYSKSKEEDTADGKKTYYEIGSKQGHRTTEGAYVFTIPMNNKLEINPDEGTIVPASKQYEDINKYLKYGQAYVIKVSGKDNEGNPIENYEDGYGFRFSSGGGAPELKISTPEETTVFYDGKEDVLFEGYAKSDDGEPIISVLYDKKAIKIHNGNSEELIESIHPNKVGDDTYPFSFRIPKEWFTSEGRSGSKTYTFTVSVSRDEESESKTEVNYSIWYDVDAPEASNIKLTEVTVDAQGKSVEKNAYKDEANNNKYYVNNTGKTFNLSGMVTDNFGVDSVKLELKNKADESKTITETKNESTGKWSFENLNLSQWTGSGATAKITIKDKSGNISVVNLDIVFDVTPPAAEHQIDDSQKDLVFRIGDYSNDAGDADVGGKYSDGTYGSAITMQIRGNFTDDAGGSGINKFYYKTFNNQEVVIDATKASGTTPVEETGKLYFKNLDVVKAYVIANKTDTFSPLTETETKKVEYNIQPSGSPASASNTIDRLGGGILTNGYNLTSKGYVQFRKDISSNYKTVIKGFKEGKNFLVIVAEDNAGNTSVDYAQVGDAIYPCYSLNVDITPPTIPEKQEGIVYTNVIKKAASNEQNPDLKVEISGTVSDKSGVPNGSSGLKNIVFTSDQSSESVTLNSSDFTGTGTAEDSTLRNWTADIRPLLETSGTAIISAKVTDNAGFETSMPVATIIVDMTGPGVRITSPSVNSKTGTEITLSGTASDGNGAGLDEDKKMILYYTTNSSAGASAPLTIPALDSDASAGWKKLADFDAEEDWTCTLNVSSLSEVVDGNNTEIFFTVSAEDKAGSGTVGYAEPLRIVVDRKKPQIDDVNSGLGTISSAENIRNHWYNTTNLKLSGSYTDEAGSGVASVSYKLGSEDKDISTFNGSYSTTISNFAQGENRLVVWATDAVGNKSDETEYLFNIDSIVPEITSITGANVTKGENVNLTINIKDTNPETPEVVLKKDDVEINLTASVPAGSASTYTSTVTVPFESDSSLIDGNYEIIVTVKDKAGNTATETHKILKDGENPEITFTAPAASQAGYEKNRSFEFKGTVTDDNLKSVNAQLYKKNASGNFEAVEGQSTSLSTNQNNEWSWKVYELEDTSYKVKVTAEDKAENSSTAESSELTVDINPPEVSFTALNLKNASGASVSAISAGDYYAGTSEVTITGTVTDPNYENSSDYVTVTAVNTTNPVTTEQKYVSSNTFTVTPDLADGDTLITITVKDLANNFTETKFVMHRDTTGPAIEIRNPQADSDNPLDDANFSFRINVSDAGVGVAKIYYKFTNSDETPSDWGTGEAFAGGDYYITRDFINGHTLADGKLTEGNWYLHVKAEDKSGNTTITDKNAVETEPHPRHFIIDKAAPSIDYVKYGSNELTEKQNFYYDAATFTLSGLVSDTNGLLKVNGEVISNNDGSLSFDITPSITANQRSDFIVEVEDVAHRKTTKTYYVYKDTVGPEINLNSPAASVGTLTDNTYEFLGSIIDAGAGISTAKYLFTQTSIASEAEIISSAEEGTNWEDIEDGNFDVTKTLGAAESNNLIEGKWYLYIYAKDNVTGNLASHKTVISKAFWVDKDLPNIDETTVGTTGTKVKAGGSLTLSGTASDGNGIDRIEITEGTGAGAKTWTISESAITNDAWSQTIEPGNTTTTLADGTHTLTITAIDKAGRANSIQRTVVVDTVAPTHGTLSITSEGKTVGTGDAAKTWFNSSFINIKVENVEDAANGSGISSVEYTIESGDEAHWYPMSNSNTTYTATVNCTAQGLNTIRVRISDVVGNTTNAGQLLAYIDTVPPTLENSKVKYLTDSFEAISELLLNGDYGYALQIEAKDLAGGDNKNSGVESVTYFYDTESNNIEVTETDTNGYWNITVPVGSETVNGVSKYSSESSNKIYAIIKDNAGNEIKERILTVTKDTTPPTVEIKSFTRAGSKTTVSGTELADVNGTITISGIADDTNRFGSVKLEYTDGSKDENNETVWTLIPMTSQSSWEATLNTTALEDKTKYTIKATATDAAGNTATDTQDVYVKQDSDRPVITLSNLVLAGANATSYLKSTSKLEGTISDDDGNVKELHYSTNGTSFTPITLQYGTAWNIPGLSEGDNTIYFKVKDAKDTVFTTVVQNNQATAEDETQPKIKDAKETPTYVTHTKGSLALSFKVVTKKPDVQNLKYSVYNSTEDKWEDRTSLGVLGGIYTKFKVSLEAKAVSSIASVTASYNNTDYSFTCSGSHEDGNFHTWQSGAIPVETDKTNVNLTIADASDANDPMTTEQSFDFSIDDTAPTIKIKEPSSTVGVKETMQFDMTEDATSYYAVTRKFKVSDNGAETTEEYTDTDVPDSAWTPIVDTSNGLTRYVFFDDDSTETDKTDRFALYLTEATPEKPNRLGIIEVEQIETQTNPYETITPVKFWVKAVDACGNTGYSSTIVNVDPLGNRPNVTLGSPKNTEENGVSIIPKLGGTIRLDGNVSDDKGAKFVWLQLARSWTEKDEETGTETNVSKPFNAEALKYLVTKGYTIGKMTDNTDVAEDTINNLTDDANVSEYAIKIPVSGNSWNFSINGNQEFNQAAEVDIEFTIYATDEDKDAANISHIHRSLPVTQSIKIDSRTPYINTSELVLVKYDGDTEVARKAYKDGEDVDGIWYLQGVIKDDDSGLKTVEYKKNGEKTYTPAIKITDSEATTVDNVDSVGGDSHFYFKKIRHSEDPNNDGYTKYDYEFSVPLGNAAENKVGTDTIQIHAVENTNQNLPTEPTFKVTYDNKPPVFNIDSENPFVKLSEDIYNSSGFYTFGAIVSEDAEEIGNEKIYQSGVERIAFYFTRDLDYSLSELPDRANYSSHTEEKDSKTNDLFDVMIYRSGQDDADVSSGNMIVNYKGKSEGNSPTLKYSEGLYWRTHTGTSSGKTFTYTGDADPNIHAGGLVKINGVIYTIKTIDGNIITVEKDIEGTSADFALCNVIDHGGEKNSGPQTSSHGYGFGYYGSRVTDDGDLITETFTPQGTDYIFDASINSKNLPDGPITLHMVAFDKAGNVTTTPHTVDGTVKNNAPRIAGLILGTDENGNGTVDDGEFVNAYSNKYDKGYDKAKNEMHDVSFPIVSEDGEQKSLLTVKGLTVVKPEIIGGNGAISYTYEVYPYNQSTGTWPETTTINNNGGDLKDASGTEISGTTDDVVTGQITLPVSDFIGTTNGSDTGAIPDGTLSKFLFKFGDSTPGNTATDATGKNTATMAVYMDVALRETNKAKNWILPFYWKSASDNSLFKQSTDEGHIELGADWVTTSTYTTNAAKAAAEQNAEYDADPKVSGKIKIEGIAQDDTLLREIKVQFGKLIGTEETPIFAKDTDKTIASYDFASGKWGTVTVTGEDQNFTAFGDSEPTNIPDTGWVSYVKHATYQDLLDVGIIENLPQDTDAITTVPYNTQIYGHVVHWILYLDTEKVSNVAATDVTVTASATDRGRPAWSSSENEGNGGAVYTANDAEVTGDTANSGAVTKSGDVVTIGALTGRYRMDVVPYISGIKTGLSSLKKNNSSVFDRTSLGHYSVSSTEDIYLYGFNLNGGTLYDSSNTPNSATLTETNVTSSFKWYSTKLDFTKVYQTTYDTENKNGGISAFASGDVSVKVKEIESLNNKNSNDSKGQYTDTTTSKTGDKSVYDNYYNRQPNGDNNNLLTDDVILDVWDVNSKVGKPAAGVLTQLSMDINPVSGKVGFAFRNGALMMSMGSIDYSYDYWLCGLDVWTSIGFAYDDLGYGWGTAAGGDINEKSADSFALISSRWGKGTLKPGDGHNDGNNQLRPYTIGQKDYDESGKAFVNIDKERFQSPTLATTVEGTASTVYLAYYDNINNEIRFHWGTFTTNTKDNKMVQNLFFDAYGNSNAINGKDVSQDYAKYRLDYTSLIAGQTRNTHPFDSNTPTDTRVLASDGTEVHAGKYVSIAALKGKGTNDDDAVVAVWYDATHNHMLYSYNKSPKSIAAGKFRQADTGWSKPVAIFGEGNGIGEYCKITADKQGGAHIVAYDSLNADVLYAYIPSFDAPGNAKTCIVDSYGLIGTELDIDVALDDNNKPLPFISYYAGSNALPKIARWAGSSALTTASLTTGAEDDMFTGAWDISLIPTSSKIGVDHVNVGVWKNMATGKIKDSKVLVGEEWQTGLNTTEQTGTSYNSSVSRGNIYGNGTKNAILGYAINEGASGFIETAQMK